jgi:hypothetical protein
MTHNPFRTGQTFQIMLTMNTYVTTERVKLATTNNS